LTLAPLRHAHNPAGNPNKNGHTRRLTGPAPSGMTEPGRLKVRRLSGDGGGAGGPMVAGLARGCRKGRAPGRSPRSRACPPHAPVAIAVPLLVAVIEGSGGPVARPVAGG